MIPTGGLQNGTRAPDSGWAEIILAPHGRPDEPAYGAGAGGGVGGFGGDRGGEGWSVLAEWAGPAFTPGPALPAHRPQAPAGMVPAAAGLRPAAMAAASAQVPPAESGGVEEYGGPCGRAGCESDWDPFHDDWHAW
jgi:hypothetical protein